MAVSVCCDDDDDGDGGGGGGDDDDDDGEGGGGDGGGNGGGGEEEHNERYTNPFHFSVREVGSSGCVVVCACVCLLRRSSPRLRRAG